MFRRQKETIDKNTSCECTPLVLRLRRQKKRSSQKRRPMCFTRLTISIVE